MKIIGVKTNKGFYITENVENKSYYSNSQSPLLNYIINGNPVKQTFHKSWVFVDSEPKIIEQSVSQPSINKRYELIDAGLSDKFKPVWTYEEARKYDGEEYINADGFVLALYAYKEDAQPNILKSIDFEYTTIEEIEEIKTPKHFSYKRAGQWDREKYQDVTPSNVKFDMISQIITPEILLHTQPCKLSKKESYDIIRKFIKENINGKVAEISSDYDFCLTVKKKITLSKPHTFKVDINDNFFGLLGKKKKPKYETRIQTSNKVTVFECAPAPYQSYTVLDAFEANSQDELKELIDNYLNHLISVINEPLQYCDCCSGTGVKSTD